MSRAKGRLQAIRRKIRANRHGEAAIQGVNSEGQQKSRKKTGEILQSYSKLKIEKIINK